MTLVTWHRSELTEEFGKLRRDLSPSLLNSLVQAGLVPTDESQPGPPRYTALAIVPLLQAQASAQPFEDARLPREVRPFIERQRGVAAANSLCIQRVEQTLVRCASLGLLANMLPQWDSATVESLRGDARLEWRLNQLLTWLRAEAAKPVAPAVRPTAPSLGVVQPEAQSGSGWTVPSVPTLAPVFGAVAPPRPAPAVSASFAERLARISAAVGKPAPIAPAVAAAAAPVFSAPTRAAALDTKLPAPPTPNAKPAATLPRPLPKRQAVERVVSDEVEWGFEQVAPSSNPVALRVPTPVSPFAVEPPAVVAPVAASAASVADAPAAVIAAPLPPVSAPPLAVESAAQAPEAPPVVEAPKVVPAAVAAVVEAPAEAEPAPAAPEIAPDPVEELPASTAHEGGLAEALGLSEAELGTSLGTAISIALSSTSDELGALRSPTFEISPELFEPSEPVAPSLSNAPASSASVTESVWSEADAAAATHEPARWELAVDAVRRLKESGSEGRVSPYAEAMAANAVAACLECEIYEVEPDLLQFADDAAIELVELVWRELEPELSNSDRAELAVRFAERLSRRRDSAERVALRKQIVGVCRLVLNDPALAFDLLTDRFAAVDVTQEECDLLAELAEETANQVAWSSLLDRAVSERPELASLFSGYRLEAMEQVGDLTGVADALERTLSETTDPLAYLALLRRTMTMVETDLGDLHRAAELARNAVASGRFDDKVLGELDRLYAEAWRFEELSDLLLNAVASEPAGSIRLTAVIRRAYYLARDHFSDPLLASRKMAELLLDPRHDAAAMLTKVVLPTDYDQARREADALRELALVRPDEPFMPAIRVRAAYLYAIVLGDDDSGAEQLMAALPRIGDDPALIVSAEQVMFALTRSTEYGADAVGWLLARAHSFEDRAAALSLMVELMQLPVDAAISDEVRAEVSEDAVALADSPEVPPAARASAHLAVARAKRSVGAVRTAAYHAVQAAENAADEEVDEQLFADALAELGDLGGSSLRAWGGDEVSARALFSSNLVVLLNFGRLCSEAGAWPQAVRAFERAVPLLRAADDEAGAAAAEQQLEAARQQLAS